MRLPWSRAAGFALALLALVTRVVPCAAEPATPPSAFFQYGEESVAFSDGPGSLRFNPAAGLRYQDELSGTLIDNAGDKDWGRAAFTRGPITASASWERNAAITPSFAFASGQGQLRYAAVATWWPTDGGERVMDYRAGLVALAYSWLTIGFVADHLTEPDVGTLPLQREYTLGVGVRPLMKAGRWGQRVVLTVDRWFDGGDSDPEYRYGAWVMVAEGIELRGRFYDVDDSFQVGLSLLAPRSGYHLQSRHDRGGDGRYATHTLSFHQEQDPSVLVPDKPGRGRNGPVQAR